MRLLCAIALVLALVTPVSAETTINAHHTWTTIGQNSRLARASLSFRKYLGLINDGAAVVYCTVDGQQAVANEGIRLAAAGTTGDRIAWDRNVPQGAVWCIAASGSNRILVIEGR